MDKKTLEQNTVTIKRHFKNTTGNRVLAIYLTGSRLNKLDLDPNTDYDLFVIVEPSKKELIHGTASANEAKMSIGSTNYEVKLMNTLQFLNIIEKVNPNTVEVLFAKPMYIDEEFAKFSGVATQYAISMNEKNFVNSILGQIKQTLVKLRVVDNDAEQTRFSELDKEEQEKYINRRIKLVVNALKFSRYLQQYVETGKLQVEFDKDERLISLKHKLYEESKFDFETFVALQTLTAEIDERVKTLLDEKFTPSEQDQTKIDLVEDAYYEHVLTKTIASK